VGVWTGKRAETGKCSVTRKRAAAASIALVTGLAAALSGCGGATPSNSIDDIAAGFTVEVFQSRADVPKRFLEISILNGSSEDVTITAARFDSGQFLGVADWTKRESTFLRAGNRVDLPVALPSPSCSGAEPTHFVELEFAASDGSTGEARMAATDRLDRLPALSVEDCLGKQIALNAAISTGDALTSITAGSSPTATLTMTIIPTAAAGSVQLHSLRGTVLLNLLDQASGTILTERPIDQTVNSASAPIELSVTIGPQRCDPHVVAEDKRGTYLPMSVTAADGTEGTIYLEASPSLREAIYDFVATACGFAEAGTP
jgi:hypothetical protein